MRHHWLVVPFVLVAGLAVPAVPALGTSGLPGRVCGAVEVRAGADGVVRGFASGTCSQAGRHDGVIRYVERHAGAWSWRASPYVGAVLGVADNGRETFLMYENPQGMYVTKRGHDGTFSGPGWHLAGATAGGDVAVLADGFLAVWVRPAATPQGLDLVSWGRYGGAIHPRTVVTGNAVPDVDPTLVTPVTPPGARQPTVYLAWTRVLPDRSEVRFAQGPLDTGWSSRAMTGMGTHNEHPDLALGASNTTWAAWWRDGGQWDGGRALVTTSDAGGAFQQATTLPGSASGGPQVAVGSAPTLPVVGYVTAGRVVLAWRSAGVWATRTLGTGAHVADVAAATIDVRGSREATVLYTGTPDGQGNAALHSAAVLFTAGVGD